MCCDLINMRNWSLWYSSGNEDHLYQLAVDNLPIAHTVGGNYPGLERGDIISLGYEALVKAGRKWNPERGSFSNYCRFFLRKEFGREVSKRRWPEGEVIETEEGAWNGGVEGNTSILDLEDVFLAFWRVNRHGPSRRLELELLAVLLLAETGCA